MQRYLYLTSNRLSVYPDNNFDPCLHFEIRSSVDLMVKTVLINKRPVYTNKSTEKF